MMAKQQRLFGRDVRPPVPTVQTEAVALAIATRIVTEVNMDEFYWTKGEVPDCVLDVQDEIMRHGEPKTVFFRLWQRGMSKYGWEGIEEHCEHIAGDIADEELKKARLKYAKRYM